MEKPYIEFSFVRYSDAAPKSKANPGAWICMSFEDGSGKYVPAATYDAEKKALVREIRILNEERDELRDEIKRLSADLNYERNRADATAVRLNGTYTRAEAAERDLKEANNRRAIEKRLLAGLWKRADDEKKNLWQALEDILLFPDEYRDIARIALGKTPMRSNPKEGKMTREEMENAKIRLDVEIKRQEVELIKARVARELAEAELTKANAYRVRAETAKD